MSKRQLLLMMPVVCRLAMSVSLLLLMTSTVGAQQGPPPPGDRNPKLPDRQRELREKTLRSLEMGAALEKRDQRRIEAAIKQVQEDFKQIQIVRNEMVRRLLASKPLDYKLIANEVGEINKRAERLKTYLIPRTLDNKEKSERNRIEFKSEEIKAALVQLCNRIAGFVDNPVLKTPGVTDVEQSANAADELLSIVELSGNIKRSADRLYRVPK